LKDILNLHLNQYSCNQVEAAMCLTPPGFWRAGNNRYEYTIASEEWWGRKGCFYL